MKKEVKKYVKVLEKVKQDNSLIKDFLYPYTLNDEELSYDKNSLKRLQLLIAMQLTRPLDEELLVYLLKSEIEAHNKAPFQGLDDSLKLNAFLLSEFKNTSHIPLFIKAKNANFDTYCGFSREFIVSAGIAKSYEAIKLQSVELQEEFYDMVGKPNECIFTEEDILKWKEMKQRLFPKELIFNSIVEEIDLAIELGLMEIAKPKIEEWEKSITVWNTNNLIKLRWYKKDFKDVDGEIWVLEKLLEISDYDDDDSVSKKKDLVKLLIQKEKFELASNYLKQIHKHLKKVDGWKEINLGRYVIESHFDLVLAINDKNNEFLKEAYNWGFKYLKKMKLKRLHWNLIEKSIDVFNLMDEKKLGKKYTKFLKKEKDLFDNI